MSEAVEKEAAPPLGQGRYRLLDVLGAGGMATVYRAHDRRLDVHRAIKVLTPTYASNPDLRKRFLAEARVLARLYHPNIVMCHDIGVDGDRLYIVMELVEGGGLWERMRETGPLSPVQALDVMLAVLPALQVAHDHNVIHRDIKPGNILVGKDSVYKLADFGIARAAQQQDDDSRTRTGSMLGTPSYMAPEQWAAGRDLDARADIFAMGATLYSLVSLQTPQDIHINEMQDEQLRDVHPALAMLIRRACRYRANERFGSAIEMLAAVKQARDEMSSISANMTVGGVRKASSGSREQLGPMRKNIKPEPQPRDGGLAAAGDGQQRPTLAPTDALTLAPANGPPETQETPAVSFELSFRAADGLSAPSNTGSRPRAQESAPRPSVDGPSQVMRRPPELAAAAASTPFERVTPEPTLPILAPLPQEPILTRNQIVSLSLGLVLLLVVGFWVSRDSTPAPPPSNEPAEAPPEAQPVVSIVAAPEAPTTTVVDPATSTVVPPPIGPTGSLVLECRPTCDILIDGVLSGHDKVTSLVAAGQREIVLRSTGTNFRALKVVPADGEATMCYDFGTRGFCGP